MVVSGEVRPTPVTLNSTSTASQRIKLHIFTAAERIAREFARERNPGRGALLNRALHLSSY